MVIDTTLQDRRTVLKSIGASAGALGLAGCTGGDGSNNGDGPQDRNVRWGVGASGSAMFSFGTAAQRVIRENSDWLQVSAQETGGSAENIRLIGSDPAQMELSCPTDFVYDWGVRGVRGFDENPLDVTPYQGGTPPFIGENYIVAVDGSGIETLDDLAGKNVWPLWAGASIRDLAQIVFTELGYWSEFNTVDAAPSEVGNVVNEGRIDALVVYQLGGGLTGWTQQLDAQADLHLVEMSDNDYETLEGIGVPPAKKAEVKGWSSNDHMNGTTVPMWTNSAIVAYHPTTPQEVGYEFTKIIHENGKSLQEDTGTAPDLSDPEVLVETILPEHPVHPGAAEYFKEIDAWDDNWTTGEIQ